MELIPIPGYSKLRKGLRLGNLNFVVIGLRGNL